jgi:hypothetical protein
LFWPLLSFHRRPQTQTLSTLRTARASAIRGLMGGRCCRGRAAPRLRRAGDFLDHLVENARDRDGPGEAVLLLVTHVAARLEQITIPGSVLISPETLALAEGYVMVKPLGTHPIKGLERPLEVHELIGAATVRSRFHAAAARGLTRFVGRESELDQLSPGA